MNYLLNEPKMYADTTEGSGIVINSITGIYYGMNKFGTSVYENLVSGSSSQEVVEALEIMPGAPSDIRERVESFIESLLGYEILIPAPEESRRTPVFAEEVAIGDSFVPECVEYNDVQELLYADPIHDVDEEIGWAPE